MNNKKYRWGMKVVYRSQTVAKPQKEIPPYVIEQRNRTMRMNDAISQYEKDIDRIECQSLTHTA